MQDWLYILAGLAGFSLLIFLRVKVFQMRAGVQGKTFCFSQSLHLTLRVLASLLIPGLGQAMGGRMAASALHLGMFLVALCLVGEVAFLLNLVSAMEHVLG